MAALLEDKLDVEVTTTPSQKTGEITVWLDGARVFKKWLPFVTPNEAKVIAAVEAALP